MKISPPLPILWCQRKSRARHAPRDYGGSEGRSQSPSWRCNSSHSQRPARDAEEVFGQHRDRRSRRLHAMHFHLQPPQPVRHIEADAHWASPCTPATSRCKRTKDGSSLSCRASRMDGSIRAHKRSRASGLMKRSLRRSRIGAQPHAAGALQARQLLEVLAGQVACEACQRLLPQHGRRGRGRAAPALRGPAPAAGTARRAARKPPSDARNPAARDRFSP